MIKHTNTHCLQTLNVAEMRDQRGLTDDNLYDDNLNWQCGEPAWVTENGIRVNTPLCERHAREFNRPEDLEASMGN